MYQFNGFSYVGNNDVGISAVIYSYQQEDFSRLATHNIIHVVQYFCRGVSADAAIYHPWIVGKCFRPFIALCNAVAQENNALVVNR